jgi:hypothetical protein
MKVKWESDNKTFDITEFISTVSWVGSARQASRSLEITVLNSPYDKNIKDLKIKPGDRIKLFDDSKLLIDAMVYYRERKSEAGTITYSGYDDLTHLLRSNYTCNFKNVTPKQVAIKVCNQLQIAVGKIEDPNINIKSMLVDDENYYDIILKAYRKAYKVNGKKYMPIMVGRKLYIIEKGELIESFVLNDKVNITNSTYTESLEPMVNKVIIYDEDGKQKGEVKNIDWIKNYGIFQSTYTKEDGVNANTAAKNMLTGIEKSATIEAIGNIECISEYGVKIKDSATNLTGVFWIDNDTHTWENGVHTMELELAFKNIMETVD